MLTLTNPTTSNIESQTNYELLENTWAFVNKCIMAPVGLAWLCTVCSGIPDRGFWGQLIECYERVQNIKGIFNNFVKKDFFTQLCPSLM